METINNNITQDDYSKAKNKYLEIKWKIEFKDYKDEKEREELIKQKKELEEEWRFEEKE